MGKESDPLLEDIEPTDSTNPICTGSVDEILNQCGSFGRFQILLQIICMFFVLTLSYQPFTTAFIGNNPPWKYANISNKEYRNETTTSEFGTDSPDFSKRCRLKRNEWTYIYPKSYSFVTEYDLVCKKEPEAALADGAFFIGGIFGTLFSGIASDLYGRKLTLIICLTLNINFSILSSFIQEIWQLITLRILIGASSNSSYNMGFIILSEFITSNQRNLPSNLYHMNSPVSLMLLALVAYYETRWRRLQLFISLPSLISLFIFFFIPKSPRWLLAQGRPNEAKHILKKIANFNGKRLHNFTLTNCSSEKKYTYIDLFSHREVLFLTLTQTPLWMTIGLIYYTVTLETSNFGGSIYSNFALSAIADIPSMVVAAHLCGKFGRKRTVLGNLLTASFFTSTIAAVPNYYKFGHIIKITIAVIVKFSIHIAFSGIYLWSFELFPTVIRAQGWIFCEIFSRVGGFTAPFLATVLQMISPSLPYVIISVCGLIAAIIGRRLPETKDLKTREKYEDLL